MKRQNAASFKLPKGYGEKPIGVSETVPDESLTVRQILDRYSRGLPTGSRQPTFDSEATLDSEDLEKIKTMDLYEQEEYRTALANRALDLEKHIKQQQQSQAERHGNVAKRLEALEAQWKGEPTPPGAKTLDDVPRTSAHAGGTPKGRRTKDD